MHSYDQIRKNFGTRVSQTIDSPITIFDYWELGDAFAALLVVLIFGVVFYEWAVMLLLLALVLGVGPMIRRRNEKGVFLHWPYRKMGVSLPGLINPQGKKTYSD
ncbi:MAG: hypothetical protein AB7T49_19875 [Oligoflexales bacterium]|jgi:hypothetical protein